MQRRHFLGAGAVALAAPMGLPAWAASAWQRPADFGDHAALQTMRGLQGQDLACDAASIEGKLPAGLRGTLFRNGPALFERAGQRYRHWFDGDGLVQAWRFDGAGNISHRGRFVRTTKFIAGDSVRVTEDLNFRSAPGTSASIIAQLPAGTTGTILAGPQTASGYLWYQFRTSGGTTGWGAQDWLEKTSGTTTTTTTPAPSGKFVIGDSLRVTEAVNFRSSAGTSSSVRSRLVPAKAACAPRPNPNKQRCVSSVRLGALPRPRPRSYSAASGPLS